MCCQGAALLSAPLALTCAVLVDLNATVEHLCHGLHLNVVSHAALVALPVDISGEVLRHIL